MNSLGGAVWSSPDLEESQETEPISMSNLKLGPFPRISPYASSCGTNVTVWDQIGRTQIAQIFVSYGEVINSIAFQYIEGDKLVFSPLFGSQRLDASNFVAVVFKEAANNEYVTRVSGGHALNASQEGITSLTIETNAGCYGPFGTVRKNDIKFEYNLGPNQFGGFHGVSSSDVVRSIGVYVKPITSLATLSATTSKGFNSQSNETLRWS